MHSATCGNLTLTAIAENAIRIRCRTSPSPLPELIYQKTDKVAAILGHDAHSSWIRTSHIRATVDKETGALRFFNATGQLLTQELPNGRHWAPRDGAADSAGIAEVSYPLQPGEHLYGSGQFQDGFLNIARLPRRLLQLNTQISVPFLLSSKGYGLLWHQYGMTEINTPANEFVLKETGAGPSVSVDVTTSAGTQRQSRKAKQFEGSFTVPQDGDYALQLDSGRTMTDRWNLVIDDKPVIDFSNFWLPGSTSTIAHLSAGSHHVSVQGNAADHPSLKWGLAQDQTTFRSPDAPGIDYTVFAGSADEVIASYRRLSGGTPMFPKWAFGFIQCRERYHSSEEILDTLQQFRKDQLPLDVIVQDWQYWGKYGWNAMKFDEQYYPDPAKLVNEVHADHAHLMVSVWSRFDPKSDVGKQFQEHNYFIPGTTWVDFLNPAAAQLYWQNFSTRMRSLGIDAWWLDATEPENDDLHGRSIHLGSGDRYRLVYPLFVTRTVYEGSRRDAPNQRSMILTRSAFLGQQRYGIATWSGDIGNGWDTLKRQVTAGLDYMASGMPYWTTDTGGFFRPGKEQYTDPAYHERFLRWMGFSTFSPLMRVHGYQTNTEPWNYGPEMVQQERQLLNLRYQLLPYLYSQANAVTSNGGTIMRPLVMDFPHDQKALDQKYEYMFGPSFLVAPVLEPGVKAASVYAPEIKGGWYDWWTGDHVAGGQETTVDAPVERIPVLVRAGSIVPLAPVQQYAGEQPNPALELRVYPGADGNVVLYDDDGLTYGYEKGKRSLINVSWNEHAKRLVIGARQGTYSGMPSERRFHIHYVSGGTSKEKDVTYNGHKLTILLNHDQTSR
jgi:alpha-D-xyloside xylohydrolase